MSDWRFASISGYLTWTTPSAPDGGTELFSELSPTLIIALQEQGDTLPVDYIKLLSITSVSLPDGSRSIELSRDGAPPVLLVAGTTESASEWYHMILTAMGDAAGSRVKPRPAAPAPAAAAVVAAPQTVEKNRTPTPDTQLSAVPRPTSQSSLAIGGAVPSQGIPSQGGSQQGSETGSLRLQLGGSTTSAPQPSVVVPLVSSTLPSPSPRPQPTAMQPPPWVQAALQAHPAASAYAQPAVTTSDVDPRLNDIRTPSLAHSFKPLSDITGIPPLSARTTTTTTHIDPQRAPSRSTPSQVGRTTPNDGLKLNVPGPTTTNNTRSGWEPTNGLPQASWTPIASRASVLATATGPSQPSPQLHIPPLSSGMSRPLPSSFAPQSMSPIPQDEGRGASEGPQYDDLPTVYQSSMGYRKRGGMLVDVPPNPQVNRNNAPNVSAIWKEWVGPDGVQYVCHEPTGTLQRRNPDTNEFETLVDGTQEIDPQDMALHPYSGDETAVDMNKQLIKNLDRYPGSAARGLGGREASINISSPSVYRSEPITSPRGQYSPTRRSHLTSLAPPRQSQSAYNGRRVHHLTLGPENNDSDQSVEHKIQLLGGSGLKWDPQSGKVVAPQANNTGDIGASTLHRQWEHVRRILMQGRYFKKHALRTTTSSFRYVFLTNDNAYVVCVPTSEVLFNVNEKPRTFNTMAETVQYYGPESRAIALNTITHVSLGTDEQFVRNRASALVPTSTFCIVSRTHAFILECNTSEEAKYFCDAWTFFLYHSKPVNMAKQRTPQVRNPVTFGTRSGIGF